MLWFERTRHTLCHTQGAERMHLKWTEARHTGRRQRLDINLMAPCSSRMLLRYCMCWPNGSAAMLSRHTMLEHCEIRHSIGSTDSVYQLCRMGCPCLAQTMLVIVGVVCLIYCLLLRHGACISPGKHYRWSKAMCGNQGGTTILPVV